MVFANPEEELIVAESELCIDYEVIIPLNMYKLSTESLLQITEIVNQDSLYQDCFRLNPLRMMMLLLEQKGWR